MMFAVFATLAFLTTLWLVVVALVDTLDGNLAKIAAALAGRSFASRIQPAPVAMRVSSRVSGRQQRTLRAEPQLRAAA